MAQPLDLSLANKIVEQAFEQYPLEQQQEQEPLVTTPTPESAPSFGEKPTNFAKEMFGIDDPSQVLQIAGEHPNDPNKVLYTFAGDGKQYAAKKDTPLEQVLEKIWEKKSPSLWGSAKGMTTLSLPSDLSSAIAYGLGGLNLDEMSEDWRSYADDLKEEYHKKYGQYMVPGIEQALNQGKVWDYALQTLGAGAPYMGLALTGGALGLAGVGAAGVATTTATGGITAAGALGSFLGSTAITSPVMIAQFADRQVAEMRAKGIENPEDKVNWGPAIGFATLAAGLQALPVESILFAGPVLRTVQMWGAKSGTPTSARILASIADISGTNALATSGASFLSRANADMPLLDDDAKVEYLNSAIAGSIVGLPFAAYRGFKTPRPHIVNEGPPKSVEDIINDNTTDITTPSGTEHRIGDVTPVTMDDILFNPKRDYGIKTTEDAVQYLESVPSVSKNPQKTAFNDFGEYVERVTGKTFSDQDLINSARRWKWDNQRRAKVATAKDEVLIPTINDLPQVHSDKPEILTKVAALTDQFGYKDEVVRNWSDSLIEKVFDNNIKKELRQLQEKAPKEVYENALTQMRTHVDENVLKDVKEFGSVYERPVVKDRLGKSLEERRSMIQDNPRKKLAELLMKSKKDYENIKDNEFWERHERDNETQFWQQHEPLVKETEADAAFWKREELPQPKPKLLEYKPYTEIAPDVWATALDKASKRPGDYISQGGRLTKRELLERLSKDPLMSKLRKSLGIDIEQQLAAIRKAEADRLKQERKDIKEAQPKVLPDGSFSRVRPEKKIKEKPYVVSDELNNIIKGYRDRLEQVATKERQEILKANPELGSALNQIAKKFAELSSDIEIPSQSRSVKGAYGLMESLGRRGKVLSVVEKALAKVSPKLGASFKTSLDKMIAGDVNSPKEISNIITLLDTSFGLNKDGLLEGQSSNIPLINLYKTFREDFSTKQKNILADKRKFLDEWFFEEHQFNPKDLDGFAIDDIEGLAFSQYLQGKLQANFRKFKDSPHRKEFEKIEKALKQIKKELGDQGYLKTSDILDYNKQSNERVAPDAQNPRVFSERLNNGIVDKQAREALPEQSEQLQNNMVKVDAGYPDVPNMKAPKEDTALGAFHNNVGGPLYGFMDKVMSLPFKSERISLLANVHQIMLNRKHKEIDTSFKLENKWSSIFDSNGGTKNFLEASELISHMRKTDQKFKKDANGNLIITSKDGTQRAINGELSRAVEQWNDFWREGMRLDVDSYRTQMEAFSGKEEGLTKASSPEHIIRVLGDLDKKIKDNPFPSEKSRLIQRKEVIEVLKDKIGEREDLLRDPTVPYIPHMRFGDQVVMVKDRKTGKIVNMPVLNENTMFMNKYPKQLNDREIKKQIEELGIYKKYNTKDYEIVPFQLTYNNIAKYIQQGLVSTDLIQTLMASGLKDNLRMADYLATGTKFEDVLSSVKQDVKSSKERIMKYVLAQGTGKFNQKSDNIEGHSTDWGRVAKAYMNIYSHNIAKRETMRPLTEALAKAQSEQNVPPHVRNSIQKYIDYVNDPGNDMATTRWWSFMMAMGWNPSSAILQLATLPNQTMSFGIQYHPHVLTNASLLASGMKNARGVTKELHKKAKKSEFIPDEDYQLIKNTPSEFRASIRDEAAKTRLEGLAGNAPFSAHVAKQIPLGSRIKELLTPGFMIGSAEQFTRVSTYLHYKELFKQHPESLRRAIKQYEADANWQAFWDQNKETYSPETAMAIYTMRKAHGIYGKEGRPPVQQGLGGALFFPFITYAQQMTEHLFTQLSGRYGAGGVYGGLWTMGAFIGMAGLAGIPAYPLLKTLYEAYEQAVNGRTIDVDKELSEELPEWLRKGVVSSATGYDVSQRLGQDIIGQNIMIGLLKGNLRAGELGGVPGRTLQNLLEASAAALSGTSDKSPLELVMPVLPSGFQNMAKGILLEESPEKMLQTKGGKVFAQPEEIGFDDVIKQGLGFSSTEFNERKNKIYWRQKVNQELNQAKSRLAEGVAAAKYKIYLGANQDDPRLVEEGKEQLEQIWDQIKRFTKENRESLSSDWYGSFNRNWQERLMQKKNPGKIIKPSLAQRRNRDTLEFETNQDANQ